MYVRAHSRQLSNFLFRPEFLDPTNARLSLGELPVV